MLPPSASVHQSWQESCFLPWHLVKEEFPLSILRERCPSKLASCCATRDFFCVCCWFGLNCLYFFLSLQGRCINFTRSQSYPEPRYPAYNHPSTPVYTLPHTYPRRASEDSQLLHLPPSPLSTLPPLPSTPPPSSSSSSMDTPPPPNRALPLTNPAPPSPTGSLPPPPTRPPPRPNHDNHLWGKAKQKKGLHRRQKESLYSCDLPQTLTLSSVFCSDKKLSFELKVTKKSRLLAQQIFKETLFSDHFWMQTLIF